MYMLVHMYMYILYTSTTINGTLAQRVLMGHKSQAMNIQCVYMYTVQCTYTYCVINIHYSNRKRSGTPILLLKLLSNIHNSTMFRNTSATVWS